jgi:hypothetical protein
MIKKTCIYPGLYYVFTDKNTWEIERRQEDPAYGNDLLWFAYTTDGDIALDPTHTLKDAMEAIANV